MKLIFVLFILSLPVAVLAQEEPVFPQFKWSGELRVREQWEKDGDNQSRTTTRLRARFGLGVQIQKDLRAEVRLASAKSNRSTNQQLGDGSEPGSRRRFVGLDLGYAEWRPAEFAKIFVGRFPQIHFRAGDSQVILDDDLTLEGIAAQLEYEFYPEFRILVAGGTTFIRENYDNYYADDMADNNLNFGQLAVNWTHERFKFTLGAGFFNFTSVEGMTFADLAVGGKSNGNTEGVAGVVKNPYIPRNLFGDFRFPVSAVDAGIFVEYVENRETTDPNKAYWAGLLAGQKSWDARVGFLEIESDATLAMFTDSDFMNGVTNARGGMGNLRWKFQKNMAVRLTQFIAKTRLNIDQREYDRTHLDITASF